jgi:hypothetical protein
VRRAVYTGFWWANREGKRPLGRPRRGWGNNIKTDLQELRCGGIDWIDLVQHRGRWRTIVKTVLNLFGFHKIRGIS